MTEFFLEIGCEEIPAGYIEPALNSMNRELTAFFAKNRVHTDAGQTLGTPRRLAIAFKNVDECPKDIIETHLGPNVKAAYDSEGNPTKAAIGFARGKGVDVTDLSVTTTPKGEVVSARVENKGRPTALLLNEFLPKLFASIQFPKKMR